MMLSEIESQRYARQMALGEVGEEGQLRLKRARVLMVGLGGLGSPCALYLAAAGIGRMGLMDDDTVALSNLQRQILYVAQDSGQAKVLRAAARLHELNPEVEILPLQRRLNSIEAAAIFADYDLVVDGTDNFASRSLISRACLQAGRPHIYGAVSRFEGQLAVFKPRVGPCYRCLVPHLPAAGEVPNCGEAGVLGATAGVIGSLQALEAIKQILLQERAPHGRLLIFNGLDLSTHGFAVPRRPDCRHCSGAGKSLASESAELPELRASDRLDPDKFWPESAIWIDVRRADEIRDRPVQGARRIELAELETQLDALPRSANYVVCCQSGQRSRRAQEILRNHQFENVWNLRGGLDENDLSTPSRDEFDESRLEHPR